LIPPEDIKPVISRIIDNYVTEYCQVVQIVTGLNTIREILVRMPLALDAAQIEYLVEFRTFKNKSVTSAAKSLINFFRDVCPQLLPKKFIGRFTEVTEKDAPTYGQKPVFDTVEGIEYLGEGATVAQDRMLTQEELNKIKIKRMRAAVRKVDRKGFRSSSEESGSQSEGEEGEDENDEYEKEPNQFQSDMQDSDSQAGEEMGEDGMDEFSFDEEGEEMSNQDEAPELVPLNVKTTKIKPKMFSKSPNKDIIEFAPESEADEVESEPASSYHSSEIEDLDE